MDDLERELTALLNKYSAENDTNTPDFVLARYMLSCLSAFTLAMIQREGFWHGPKSILASGTTTRSKGGGE